MWRELFPNEVPADHVFQLAANFAQTLVKLLCTPVMAFSLPITLTDSKCFLLWDPPLHPRGILPQNILGQCIVQCKKLEQTVRNQKRTKLGQVQNAPSLDGAKNTLTSSLWRTLPGRVTAWVLPRLGVVPATCPVPLPGIGLPTPSENHLYHWITHN